MSPIAQELEIMKTEKEMTLEELEAKYTDEWVLVQETDWDEQGNPTKALMVDHDANRANLVQSARALHLKNERVKTFTFYSGQKLPEGFVVVL